MVSGSTEARMDVDLRFTGRHISNCVKKAFACLKFIYSQRQLLNANIKKILCTVLME